MSGANVIPAWLQWAWAFAGLGVALGGLLWILLIFWPYLRWSKRMTIRLMEMTDESLRLARSTVSSMEDFQRVIHGLEGTVHKFEGLMDNINVIISRSEYLVNQASRLASMLPEDDARKIISLIGNIVSVVNSPDKLRAEVKKVRDHISDHAKMAMNDFEKMILVRINNLIGDILFSSIGVEQKDGEVKNA